MAVKAACGNGFPLNIPSVIPESGGSGGTSDYSDLTNKPQINSVTLSGNKSLSDIGAASAADVSDIQDLIPSDASTTNKLATADDIPDEVTGNPSGSATAGNLTKLKIGSDIYTVPTSSGNISYIETSSIVLNSMTWTASGAGVYYGYIENVVPADNKIISVIIINWNSIRSTDNFIFYTPENNPRNIGILSANNTFADPGSDIKLRVAYVPAT